MIGSRFSSILISATATCALAACGGGGSGGGGTPLGGSPSIGGGMPVAPASVVSFGNIATSPFAIGEKRMLAPSESNYGGTFTVTSSNANVLSVNPASGAGPFTLTGVSVGKATITAADRLGHNASLTFAVTASAATPGSTPVPIATTAPGASPVPAPTATPIALPIPTSSPVAGQPTPTPPNVTVRIAGLLKVTLSSGGTISASVANPAIANVVPLGEGAFDIIGISAGETELTFTSASGTSTLIVSVPATLPAISVPNVALSLSVARALGLNAAIVSAGEPGYTGAFVMSAGNPAVAIVAPVFLTKNQFLVTSVGSGSTFLTLQDSIGHTQYLDVNVP